MTTPILVVGTGVASVAPARFPAALARAGATVSLLVPANAQARHTRHVVRVGLVPPGAPTSRWTEALFALVDAAAPRAIVPADAGALDFLTALVLAPPPTLRPERVAQLAPRLEDALGSQEGWPARIDPHSAVDLLARANVRTPESRLVATAAEAEASAHALGGAVVVRAPTPRGPRALASAATAQAAFARVTASSPNDPRALVERRVAGASYTHHVAAHRGRVVASATAEHVVVEDGAGRRPTVLRFCVHDDIALRAERAVAALGAGGCCALDFVVGTDGEAWLVDVDRHVVPTAHVSRWLGVDLAGAWLAALDGRPPAGATALPAGTSRFSVAFPQEWRRDSGSRWLRDERVDVPWDDPDLLEAILDDAAVARHGR